MCDVVIHLSSDYRNIHPQGLVPALDDNGHIVINSTDIMQYLDEHYNKVDPVSGDLREQVYAFCQQDESLHDPHNSYVKLL